jgi:hypothetical protein
MRVVRGRRGCAGAAALGVGQLLRSCYAALTHEEEEDFPVDDHLQIKTKL